MYIQQRPSSYASLSVSNPASCQKTSVASQDQAHFHITFGAYGDNNSQNRKTSRAEGMTSWFKGHKLTTSLALFTLLGLGQSFTGCKTTKSGENTVRFHQITVYEKLGEGIHFFAVPFTYQDTDYAMRDHTVKEIVTYPNKKGNTVYAEVTAVIHLQPDNLINTHKTKVGSDVNNVTLTADDQQKTDAPSTIPNKPTFAAYVNSFRRDFRASIGYLLTQSETAEELNTNKPKMGEWVKNGHTDEKTGTKLASLAEKVKPNWELKDVQFNKLSLPDIEAALQANNKANLDRDTANLEAEAKANRAKGDAQAAIESAKGDAQAKIETAKGDLEAARVRQQSMIANREAMEFEIRKIQAEHASVIIVPDNNKTSLIIQPTTIPKDPK